MGPLFIQVAVENTVYHFDRLFTYALPAELEQVVVPGMRVMAPFGTANKERVAMVFSIGSTGAPGVKPVLAALDREAVVSPEMLELALWMHERYYCTIFEAVRLMIPAGLQFRLKDSYVLEAGFKNFDRECFTEIQWRILLQLHTAGRSVPFEKLAKENGITESCPDFAALLEKGIVCKVNTASGRIKDAVSKMVRPVSGFMGKLTPRQKDVYNVLLDAGEASEKELCYFTGASSSVLKALVDKGAAETFEYEIYRRPHIQERKESIPEFSLSEEQERVLKSLIADCRTGGCSLLYGVTGSGKTSVFLKLIQFMRSQGKAVIAMVPEISLTAQTIRQFQQLFGDEIAVFHSGLSLGERLDEWKRVHRGEAQIVVGTRSAVFAPVQNLGLIVIDEEQEHTYQSESSPRYDAREVARYRCYKAKALCLLSSATPSVESCRMAQEKKYRFHQLTARFGEAQIPNVELIDMNEETPDGTEGGISSPLAQALRGNYEAGHQSIILLNRRGYHTFASCRSCHEVVTCPNCSISLTYHSANRRLMCHYCGYSIPYTSRCPSCGGETLRFRGSGTQQAEEQLQEILPQAKILRVDTDSVSARHSLDQKLESFAQGEYDVMVGTQMVAKGLDFENVTLVGVLSADQALYSDDFRSNERTFDLLTQVVGRAGRGRYPGAALIQTYAPENPVLALAAEQDYFSFYRREITYRQALLYPPFVDLLVIGFVGGKEGLVKQASEQFLRMLSELARTSYSQLPLRVLRPSPAAVAKMGGKYRYKLIIKCRNSPTFREMMAQLLCSFAKLRDFREVTAYADSNPYTIL